MTAPYRDDTDSLEARHAALSEELSSVQARTKELDELKASEARLESEVADVAKKLEGRAARRALPLLDSVKIASPCTASWDEMVGDERARFCTHCQKDVFNLSALPREEAETFLRARTTEVCIRVYKRADGTVLTSDCPVGVERKRRRRLLVSAVSAVSGGLMAAGAFFYLSARRETMMMGKMEVAPPEGYVAGSLPPMPVDTAVPVATTVPVAPVKPIATSVPTAQPHHFTTMGVMPAKKTNTQGVKKPVSAAGTGAPATKKVAR